MTRNDMPADGSEDGKEPEESDTEAKLE